MNSAVQYVACLLLYFVTGMDTGLAGRLDSTRSAQTSPPFVLTHQADAPIAQAGFL